MGRSLFYLSSLSGHRREYCDVIAEACGLTPLIGTSWNKVFIKLLRSEKLLFGTLDDSYGLFLSIALLRMFWRRKTVGIFLRPQMCFEKGLKYKAKKIIFSAIKSCKKISVYTIVPFSIRPEYRTIATDGLMDPHIWDKLDDPERACKTLLAKEILNVSAGKKVISFIGGVSKIKGITFLSNIVHKSENENNFLTVIAGKFSDDNLALLNSLSKRPDVLVFPRYITDSEMGDLYSCSNMIWSCYEPSYDQASGVFGRAVQYCKVPILRRGSVIEKLAKELRVKTIALEYGGVGEAARLLNEYRPEDISNYKDRRGELSTSKKKFLDTIRNAL